MNSPFHIRTSRKNTVGQGKVRGESPSSDIKGKLKAQAESDPKDNRGVAQSPKDPRKATRPPEMVPSARSFEPDQASSTKATRAHYAHKPIVRGTMHSRKMREGVRPGDREMASVRSDDHVDEDND